MILTRDEFEQKFNDKSLRIAFIGMSNIGKSHRSQQFSDKFGFEVYGVDDKMWDLQGFSDWEEASRWMGYPFDEQYEQTQKDYLEMEKNLTLKCSIDDKNIILDTTGSVIYLDEEVVDFIKNNFLVIALDASSSLLKIMKEEFFVKPKTIVWGDHFEIEDGEHGIDALRRCYPSLLEWRIAKYRDFADVIIPGEVSRSSDVPEDRFFEIIKNSLPKN